MNLPGNFGLGGDEPEWTAARNKFFEVLDKHDKLYGSFFFVQPPFGSAEGFKAATERMSFFMASADVMHLSNLYDDLKIARGLVDEVRSTNNDIKRDEVGLSEKPALSTSATGVRVSSTSVSS